MTISGKTAMSGNDRSGSGNGLRIAGFIVSTASLFPRLSGIAGAAGRASLSRRSQAVREGGKTRLAAAGIILGIIDAGYRWIQLMRLSAKLSQICL